MFSSSPRLWLSNRHKFERCLIFSFCNAAAKGPGPNEPCFHPRARRPFFFIDCHNCHIFFRLRQTPACNSALRPEMCAVCTSVEEASSSLSCSLALFGLQIESTIERFVRAGCNGPSVTCEPTVATWTFHLATAYWSSTFPDAYHCSRGAARAISLFLRVANALAKLDSAE